MQWFFSGIGKVGPWFTYVNGPFILQSKIFAGQQWLFKLLIKSPDDLSPTFFGVCLGHFAAAAEYLAPVALMMPVDQLIWIGLITITGMHLYILMMPAPFDVYSWNLCFGLSGVYLFYIGSFGLDHLSGSEMSPWLTSYLLLEYSVCWYGQFFPDRIGYYLSHRYWAGNWVQTFFLVKKTEAVKLKLDSVKTFQSNPLATFDIPYMYLAYGYMSLAYLWLGNMNMKLLVRLLENAIRSVDGARADIDEWQLASLLQLVLFFMCLLFRLF
ncbi:unnamed protein product [Polarella glacialis]|uniref:Uncharacterized protein n=1 Tax=Polarella glacialis TaxID=89957 RepID=A0A813DSU7_POLGL|nr:unnamed protein product [Polarella glacialis]CAE8656389.1 unnamed protein product [Polarella glacialis]